VKDWIDWHSLSMSSDRAPYTLRLIEARIALLVVQLEHPEASADPAMASIEHRLRAIATDARSLWDEIRLRRGLIEALISANEDLGSFSDALRTLERPWIEYLFRTQRHYVEKDVSDGLAAFSLWMYAEHDKQRKRAPAAAAPTAT
jgi:hypothetical protein